MDKSNGKSLDGLVTVGSPLPLLEYTVRTMEVSIVIEIQDEGHTRSTN